MTTINLKDFYPWYIEDQFIEVSDAVAEELRASRKAEAAHQRQLTRNKAQCSLDCDDGIEYSACMRAHAGGTVGAYGAFPSPVERP